MTEIYRKADCGLPDTETPQAQADRSFPAGETGSAPVMCAVFLVLSCTRAGFCQEIAMRSVKEGFAGCRLPINVLTYRYESKSVLNEKELATTVSPHPFSHR
jgi:hypothetical protein